MPHTVRQIQTGDSSDQSITSIVAHLHVAVMFCVILILTGLMHEDQPRTLARSLPDL